MYENEAWKKKKERMTEWMNEQKNVGEINKQDHNLKRFSPV